MAEETPAANLQAMTAQMTRMERQMEAMAKMMARMCPEGAGELKAAAAESAARSKRMRNHFAVSRDLSLDDSLTDEAEEDSGGFDSEDCTDAGLSPRRKPEMTSSGSDSTIRRRELERIYEEAIGWLAHLGEVGTPEVAFVPAATLRLAEIHEALGQAEAAAGHYARFIEMWRDADPELQPIVEEARANLRRLVPDSEAQ